MHGDKYRNNKFYEMLNEAKFSKKTTPISGTDWIIQDDMSEEIRWEPIHNAAEEESKEPFVGRVIYD